MEEGVTLSHPYNVVWRSHTLRIEEEGSGNTSTNKLCLVAVIPTANHKVLYVYTKRSAHPNQ